MLDLNFFQRFLIFCAGRDVETVRKCTSSEAKTISMIGSLVLVPVILAFSSASCAVWLVSNNAIAAFIGGLLWSIIILIADRSVVGYGRSKKFDLVFVGRVALALVASFAISVFAEIAVFSDAINEQMTKNNIADLEQISDKYDDKIMVLELELADAEQKVDDKESAYLEELDGSSGSGKRGEGEIARAKKAAYEKEAKAYEKLQPEIAIKIDRLQAKKKSEQDQLQQNFAAGILGSLQALFSIESPIVTYSTWLLRILLILLELLPIAIKMTPSGNLNLYYEIVDSDDKNKLDVHQKLNDQRMKMMEQNEQQLLLLAEFEMELDRMQRSVKINANNYRQLTEQLKQLSKEHEKAKKHIRKAVSDYLIQEELINQLENAYEAIIDSVATAIKKSNELNIQLNTD